jgi:hypothetical protein
MIIKSASDFVNSVVQIWPPFRWDEVQEKAWTQLMVRNLSGFSPAVLDRAFQDMVSKRKETRVPTPAECISACTEAKRWSDMEANDGKLPGLREHASDEWSTERVKLAYDLVNSAMGKQAAADDPCWILALWHFCRRNQRMPAGHEIEQCRRDAREFDESYRDAMRGEVANADGVLKVLPNSLAMMVQKLGASMLAKREKLRDEVLGR